MARAFPSGFCRVRRISQEQENHLEDYLQLRGFGFPNFHLHHPGLMKKHFSNTLMVVRPWDTPAVNMCACRV